MSTKWTSRPPRSLPVVVDLDGELDAARREEIVGACRRVDTDVVVDMSSVTFIDSRGYDALREVQSIVRARGGACTLVNVLPDVERHLTLIDGLSGRR